jgi:prophage regulatory protein
MEHLSILRRKQVEVITGLSRSTIYAKIQKGEFPKQVQLSERSVGWIEQEIQDWLKERVSSSRKERYRNEQ